MAEAYLGVPGNVAFPSPGVVTGASDTNPITITVSGSLPSQLTSGSPVIATFPCDIQGVQGNTAANGPQVGTITGTNTFTIPVAGNGTYTTGGSVNYQFPQSYNQPNDGDNENASSVNTAFGALGDRTLFGLVSTGAYKLVSVPNSSFDLDGFTTNYAITQASGTGGTFQVFTTNGSSSPIFPLGFNANLNDQIVFDLTIDALVQNLTLGASPFGFTAAVFAESIPPGGAGSGFSRVGGAGRNFSLPITDSGLGANSEITLRFQGIWVPTATGVQEFQLQWKPTASFSGSSVAVTLGGSYSFFAYVLRATQVPQ